MCLLGHQWISRGLRNVQYHQYTRRGKIRWTLITQEMREDLQIDFFSRNVLWTFLWDPIQRNVSIQNPPPPKKIDFFSDWVGQFEICFRSSKMIDPRPCPTGWDYLEIYRVQRRHAKVKPTTNYQLQKLIYLKRNMRGQNTSSPNVYRTFLRKKLICLASSLNNIKAG